jgi:uncharacterized pyridoxamine 5'-phosphate oxidase family protein
MGWKNSLKKGNEIVLSTCSKSMPNAIVVISQGFIGKKLLINCCQMKRTLKNLEENKNVCIVAKNKNEYYRISGKARIFYSGKYFELAGKINSGPSVKCAMLVDIKKVFDLDRVKPVKL